MTCLITDCWKDPHKAGFCVTHYNRRRRYGDALHPGRAPRGTCSIDECERPHRAPGLCSAHVRRLHRHGSPAGGSTTPMAWLAWLQAQADTEVCWLWPFATNEHGYGTVRIDRRTRKAHRVIYEMSVGEIPGGLLLRHSCDTPACVNPAHLMPGTQLDNMRDMVRHGRALSGERSSSVKLRAEDVRAIRASSLSSRLLAEIYPVNASHIRRLRRGERWVEATSS